LPDTKLNLGLSINWLGFNGESMERQRNERPSQRCYWAIRISATDFNAVA